jgi:hypothetical protein
LLNVQVPSALLIWEQDVILTTTRDWQEDALSILILASIQGLLFEDQADIDLPIWENKSIE